MKSQALSVITLTRNRAALLRDHLSSLVDQVQPDDEIIIINNNSTDQTAAVIQEFQRTLPIRAYRSKKTGFPNLYNLAIKKAKNPILLFFDDDCIADPGFLQGHRNAHKGQLSRIIQGQTFSIPKHNIYAEIMGDHYQNWLAMYRNADNIMRTFDNKNVSLPKKLLTRYGGYSPKLITGGEDIELGFRLSRHGIPIVFTPTITARHYERDTFGAFVKQHLRFASSDALLARHILPDATLSLFVWRKLFLHIKSALRRELRYITSGNILDALRLPMLYLTLLCIRVWGYTRTS